MWRSRSLYYFLFAVIALVSIVVLLFNNPNQITQISIQFDTWGLLAGANISDSNATSLPTPPTLVPNENDGSSGDVTDSSTDTDTTKLLTRPPSSQAEDSTSATSIRTATETDTSEMSSVQPTSTESVSSDKNRGVHNPIEAAEPGDCAILMLYNGDFPPFLIHTLSQIRCWNPPSDCDLWLVGNRSAIDKVMSGDLEEKKDEFQLKIGILEDLEMTEDYWYFLANTPLIKQGPFWVRATTRCFFIEAAMRKYEITDVTYFETDVMMYFSVRNFMPLWRSLVTRFAVTPTSYKQYTLGVSFIRNSEAMREFNHFQRTNYTTPRAAWEPAEMEQMVDFKKQLGKEYLYTFPTLPYATQDAAATSTAFDTERVFPSNIVFDSASWGQYYSGTPNQAKEPPGYTGSTHYVGQQLRTKCCSMHWEREQDTQRWFPAVHWTNPNNASDNGVSKIMDLHIHSKQPKYMVNSCSKSESPPDFVPLPAEFG